MPDLSIELIAWDRHDRAGALPVEDLDRVLGALATLHAQRWPAAVEAAGAGFPWCPLPERLLLTSRPMCARHLASGIPAGVDLGRAPAGRLGRIRPARATAGA